MKDLYLMRHGETLFNQRRKIQGWCDSPLTKKGIEQAKKAGELLKDIHFDHCYSSTAERCCDTLELVTHQPYQRLKGIKERYFGVFEGESEDLNPPVDKYDDFFPIYGGETAVGTYYNGTTLTAVNTRYATDKNWASGVYEHMKYLYNKL